MLKKTITYTDFDGNKRTEEFYFNLSKAELALMEHGIAGGMESKLRSIIASRDNVQIIKIFQEFIEKSYGEKSDDGRRFIKSPELSKAFMETEAYSDLFMELATDADAAAKFINAILPTDLRGVQG